MTADQLRVSNQISSVPITVIQVEMHPLLPQKELRDYCDSKDIDLVAYAPLGNGRVLGTQ